MASKNATFEQLKAVIQALTGTSNIIALPRALVRFFGGDYPLAGMMAQLIYWDDKTKSGDRWVYKTAEQWDEELCISDYQARRCGKLLESYGYAERVFRKNSDYRDGSTPVWHYRLDMDCFINDFTSFLEVGVSRTSKNSTPEVGVSQPPDLGETPTSSIDTKPTGTKPTPTNLPDKPLRTQGAAASAAGGVGGSAEKKNDDGEPVNETERLLKACGVKIKAKRRALRHIPPEVVQREWAPLAGQQNIDPAAVLVSILSDWSPADETAKAAAQPAPKDPRAEDARLSAEIEALTAQLPHAPNRTWRTEIESQISDLQRKRQTLAAMNGGAR